MDNLAVIDANQPAITSANEARGKGRPKAKAKPASEGKGKRSLNLSLEHADYERLAVHALRLDITISDLVARLAREHCREFHITRTAMRGETA